MKYDIIFAGVGGQGVLTIAALLGMAAVDSGLQLKQAEVHGMSQRGGAVQSHLRISDRHVFSDLIPLGAASMLLSLEPMEALRYLPFLSKNGVIVTETSPLINIHNYPDIEALLITLRSYPRSVLVQAEETAKDMRANRSSNIIVLGAASKFLPLSMTTLENAIEKMFRRKGDTVISQNIAALHRGRELAGLTPAH